MKGQKAKTILAIFLDILMAGIILVVFAFFHHVLPGLRSKAEAPIVVPTAAPAVQTAAPTAAPEEVEVTAAPVEDNRTPWQIKFADKFSDTVEITENSYKSPSVSIEITEHSYENEGRSSVYYVADIYIGQIENFATYLSGNEFLMYAKDTVLNMDVESGAILAMTGDYYSCHTYATMVRNGQWYRDHTTYWDICVLYRDGRMETLLNGTYDVEALKSEDVYQLWCFGPALLTEQGQPGSNFSMSDSVVYNANPRSVLGYYEPGHYCFVLVDGRQREHSAGVTIAELAEIMAGLGCESAYNLDGGGSAMISYQDSLYSRPSNGEREISDIVLIREVAEAMQ